MMIAKMRAMPRVMLYVFLDKAESSRVRVSTITVT